MKKLEKALLIMYWLCWVVIAANPNYTAIALFLIAYHWAIPIIRRVVMGQPSIYSRIYRIKVNGGHHTQADWVRLKYRFNYRCVKCQQRDPNLTKDHIIPLSRGGTDDISNIQPLCRSCNSSKGAKIVDYR